jgi:multidrug transporter EmrE-like cation transporter
MPKLSLTTTAIFAASIVFQVLALGRLPLTRGFTDVVQTAVCVLVFSIGIGLLARIIASGVPLSILIPLSAAAVPLALIIVGIVIYGEPASFAKFALLVLACGTIGVASKL